MLKFVTTWGKVRAAACVTRTKFQAIIYGGAAAPVSITLEHSKLLQAQANEGFYTHILTINVGGEEVKAIVKAMQRHPFKPKVTHVDFQRVEAGHELHTVVPVHFINEAAAVKKVVLLLTISTNWLSLFCHKTCLNSSKWI